MSLSDHFFSDATRQAFRDNYNGGRAAGDWAGVYSNPGGSRDYSVSSGQTAGDGNDRSDGTATFSRLAGGAGHGSSHTAASAVTIAPVGASVGAGPGARLVDGRIYVERHGPVKPLSFSAAPEIDGIKNVELERIGVGNAQEAPGAISDIGWIRTTGGGYSVVQSSDAKERLEDDILAQAEWFFRNKALPGLGITPQPMPDFVDYNNVFFDSLTGEWKDGQPSIPFLHHKPGRITGGRF